MTLAARVVVVSFSLFILLCLLLSLQWISLLPALPDPLLLQEVLRWPSATPYFFSFEAQIVQQNLCPSSMTNGQEKCILSHVSGDKQHIIGKTNDRCLLKAAMKEASRNDAKAKIELLCTW